MKVLITNISNYLNDTTKVSDMHSSNTVKGFFLRNLQINVYNEENIMSVIDTRLTEFFSELRPELKMIVETDYVDKVYRDTFYAYFSTKLKEYGRNCLRVSFFEPVFNTKDDFFALTKEQTQKAYRGFLIVRPLIKCIGRNAIDIIAKTGVVRLARIRKAEIPATCLGIKLKAYAFPHASQDEEYMTCAETTVWSMMEYHGHKYAIHQPVLPTDILSSIKPTSFKRQVPSTGLRLEQISMALQRQGFGCMIYENNNERFPELFTCYIESGLPLAVVVEGAWGRHAIVCIGRPPIDRKMMVKTNKAINKEYVFWNKNVELFIFNDDNKPCYQVCDFNAPTRYFGDSRISHFIVPLHKKIYLPAEQAIDKSNYFVENDFKAPTGSFVRTFLTSSRTYREYIRYNSGLSNHIKEVYLTINLPKFIWVTEVTYNQKDYYDKKVNGLILLDATGMSNEMDIYSSLIMKQNNGTLTIFDPKDRLFKDYNFRSIPNIFDAFDGNL